MTDLQPPTTKTQIAKWVAQAAVAGIVKSKVEDQLVEHTQLEEDGIAVELISGAAGYLVASRLRNHTDKAVDYTIERYQAWRKSKQEVATTSPE